MSTMEIDSRAINTIGTPEAAADTKVVDRVDKPIEKALPKADGYQQTLRQRLEAAMNELYI